MSNIQALREAVLFASLFLGLSTVASPALAQAPAQTPGRSAAPPPAARPVKPCTSVTVDPNPTYLILGKSRVVQLATPAERLVLGGQSGTRAGAPVPTEQTAPGRAAAPGAGAAAARQTASDGVADIEITLLSPTDLFFLARKTGSMNVVVQGTNGHCVVKDVIATVDPTTLQAKLTELMPEESAIKVRGADNALVLTGSVTDIVKLDHVLNLAASYGDGRKVVNLLNVTAPQQVMLEVKIAEVSKNLLDNFGLDFSRLVTSADGLTSSIISGIIGGGAATLGRFHPNLAGGSINGSAAGATGGATGAATAGMSTIGRGATLLGIDAQKRDGIIRVLAEPNIMAISGQSASFLSGGKIFIPVAQSNNAGGTTISLEEKEFGVGLRFTPTVLDGGRINLKLVSEASELTQTGSPFTTVNGATAILPSMSTRRVDTTVQLGDGQSFVVAGLIKNNVNQSVDKFPGLGEVPVMGALFRSTEFQNDQSELMFVVTPRLVRPLTSAAMLPTDNHIAPNRDEVLWMGRGEGKAPAVRTSSVQPAPAAAAPAAPPPAPVTLPTAGPVLTSRSDAFAANAPEVASAQPVRAAAVEAESLPLPAWVTGSP